MIKHSSFDLYINHTWSKKFYIIFFNLLVVYKMNLSTRSLVLLAMLVLVMVGTSDAWWFESVSMLNSVKGPGTSLTVHCKSKNDDLGIMYCLTIKHIPLLLNQTSGIRYSFIAQCHGEKAQCHGEKRSSLV